MYLGSQAVYTRIQFYRPRLRLARYILHPRINIYLTASIHNILLLAANEYLKHRDINEISIRFYFCLSAYDHLQTRTFECEKEPELSIFILKPFIYSRVNIMDFNDRLSWL